MNKNSTNSITLLWTFILLPDLLVSSGTKRKYLRKLIQLPAIIFFNYFSLGFNFSVFITLYDNPNIYKIDFCFTKLALNY